MCTYTAVREGEALPQSATGDLFTVTGGPVAITEIFGLITEDLEDATNSCVMYIGASEAQALSFSLGGYTAGGLVGLTNGEAVVPLLAEEVVAGDGVVIQLHTSASRTGEIAWYVTYRPVVPGASVEVA